MQAPLNMIYKLPNHKYIAQDELLEILPFSQMMLWRMIRREQFPAPDNQTPRIDGTLVFIGHCSRST